MIAELEKNKQNQPQTDAVPEIGNGIAAGGGAGYLFVKRVFDIVASLCACAVLLIPMLIVAAVIKLESPGPAIFKQKRMGKDGKVFIMYKFRTMHISAPHDKASIQFTDAGKYITKFGEFLRRTSIDELPQLYNVIRGDMSLVGYRPLCLTETEVNDARNRLGVFAARPGITGLAQVSGRDNLDMQEKVLMDAKYVQNRSLRLDLWCLMKTVSTVFSGEGVK